MHTQNISGPRASFGRSLPAKGYPVSSGPQAAPIEQANSDPNAVCVNLTARQRDVLAVMMQGKSNKGICRVLNLAEPTVKNHVTAILKALRVTNRTEAVIKVAKASVSSSVSASVASLSYAYTISGYSTFMRK